MTAISGRSNSPCKQPRRRSPYRCVGYRVVEDEGVSYGASSLFDNPYGFWRLEPAASAPAKRSWWTFRKQ